MLAMCVKWKPAILHIQRIVFLYDIVAVSHRHTDCMPHYENIFFEEMLILRHTLPNFDICEDRGQFFPLIMIQWFSLKCDRPVIYHKDKIVKMGVRYASTPKSLQAGRTVGHYPLSPRRGDNLWHFILCYKLGDPFAS